MVKLPEIPKDAPPDIVALLARIYERCAKLGLSETGASQAAGMSDDYIRTIRRHFTMPKQKGIEGLAIALEVTPEWLRTGEGSPADGAPFAPVALPEPSGQLLPVLNSRHGNAGTPDHPAVNDDIPQIPVYGLAAAAIHGSVGFEDEEPIEWIDPPPALARTRGLGAFLVAGDSMAPEHNDGDLRIFNRFRPPRRGDTVFIQIQERKGAPVRTWVKKLKHQDDEWVVVEQHNPVLELTFAKRAVRVMFRVLTTNELFGI